MAQTKGAHQNTSTQVNLSNAGGTVSYLTCADSQYVINTSGKSNEFSAPFLYSISKLENGEQKTIYTTTNKSLYEGVDAELPLANSEGLCVDGSILLLGTSRLATFNLSTNKLSLQELGGTTSMGLSIVNGTRDGFNYVDTKNRQLVCIGKDVGQKKTTAITSDILASPANANIRLLAFDDNSAVIARRQRLREPHHHTQGIRRIGHQGHKNCRQDGF